MDDNKNLNRREFLNNGLRVAALVGLGGIGLALSKRSFGGKKVWQLDPSKCIQCGRCSTNCVLEQSAVRCVHVIEMCGYCDLCGGYLRPDVKDINTAAENRLCPTNAIIRKYVEEPFFEYHIIEELCIGCGKCVKGCGAFGNGSLQLQVKRNICVNCNQCSIARVCPTDAFALVASNNPYELHGF